MFIKITVNNFNFDSKFFQPNGYNLVPTKKPKQLILFDHAQVQKKIWVTKLKSKLPFGEVIPDVTCDTSCDITLASEVM